MNVCELVCKQSNMCSFVGLKYKPVRRPGLETELHVYTVSYHVSLGLNENLENLTEILFFKPHAIKLLRISENTSYFHFNSADCYKNNIER